MGTLLGSALVLAALMGASWLVRVMMEHPDAWYTKAIAWAFIAFLAYGYWRKGDRDKRR